METEPSGSKERSRVATTHELLTTFLGDLAFHGMNAEEEYGNVPDDHPKAEMLRSILEQIGDICKDATKQLEGRVSALGRAMKAEK